MNEFISVVDLGSQNLRLGIFDNNSKCIYSSKIKINYDKESQNSEKFLTKLIRDAEKYLSKHLEDVSVLYGSSDFNSIDLSIKKTFDQPTLLKKQYDNLLDEANFIISENNFKDQIIHIIINNIIIDDKKLEKISDDVKIKSLIVELKFLCLKKTLISNISSIFKNNNLNISNIYCSSYVKTYFYKNNFKNKNKLIFLDIGFKHTTALIYNKNKLEFFNSVPFGGKSITEDIAKILKLDFDYSEDLKIKINEDEDELFSNKNIPDGINPYSTIKEKNISINLLKQIIEARLNEIIEIAVIKNYFFKKINYSEKLNIVFIGNSSKLILNNYAISSKKKFSEFGHFQETDSIICEAGFYYNKSEESYLTQEKKKPKKIGFFEGFFNLFSK
tara:strand:- start:2767 stop:3930 length:1164 start_codon:yes stop_codon:yes gene_type:complete